MKKTWAVQQLKTAVAASFNFRQVLVKLGLREAGGNYEQIKKYIGENKFDIAHFRGRGWNFGLRDIGKPIIPLEKILINGSYFQSFRLKKRLFSVGSKQQHCEEYG